MKSAISLTFVAVLALSAGVTMPVFAQGVVLDVPAPVWPAVDTAPVSQGCVKPIQPGIATCG